MLVSFILVIHIPVDTMITQDTDGLSRGIKMQQRNQYNGYTSLSLLCCPAPTSTLILTWALTQLYALFQGCDN